VSSASATARAPKRCGAGRSGTGCYRRRVKIAVVIPTLEESDRISATLVALAADPSGAGRAADEDLEVVVVDGGSRDATAAIARAQRARVVHSAPGRARQLQAGLESTAGETVLFLHADTTLPRGWADAVRRALADPSVVAGAFDFAFAREAEGVARTPGLDWVEWGARQRSRWLGLPYGDQALFARRDAIEAIGGVPQAALMEDLDLVVRLRGRGRIARVPLAVTTSPRRYLEGGIARTMLRHWLAAPGGTRGAPRRAIARGTGR